MIPVFSPDCWPKKAKFYLSRTQIWFSKWLTDFFKVVKKWYGLNRQNTDCVDTVAFYIFCFDCVFSPQPEGLGWLVFSKTNSGCVKAESSGCADFQKWLPSPRAGCHASLHNQRIAPSKCAFDVNSNYVLSWVAGPYHSFFSHCPLSIAPSDAPVLFPCMWWMLVLRACSEPHRICMVLNRGFRRQTRRLDVHPDRPTGCSGDAHLF